MLGWALVFGSKGDMVFASHECSLLVCVLLCACVYVCVGLGLQCACLAPEGGCEPEIQTHLN